MGAGQERRHELRDRRHAKLRQRATRIVAEIAEITHDEAQILLEQADWEVKTATVMGLAAVDAPAARAGWRHIAGVCALR